MKEQLERLVEELQQVDQGKGAHQVAVAEDQVLIELDAALAVQVDVE